MFEQYHTDSISNIMFRFGQQVMCLKIVSSISDTPQKKDIKMVAKWNSQFFERQDFCHKRQEGGNFDWPVLVINRSEFRDVRLTL